MAKPSPSPLINLLHYLRDLRQAHLDGLDPPTLLALSDQFYHWAVACDEARQRPAARSLAKSAPPLMLFTLTPPPVGPVPNRPRHASTP